MATVKAHGNGLGTPSAPRRPRVICHMIASVDGRIVTDDWPLSAEGRRQYELVHATYEADGRLCGRVTREQHFAAGVRPDAELSRENDGPPREDYVALGDHTSLQVALAWLRARKPLIVPIPRTRRLDHLTENLGAVGIQLTSADRRDLDAVFSRVTVYGGLNEAHTSRARRRPSRDHPPLGGR